jgi:hypothetical protein
MLRRYHQPRELLCFLEQPEVEPTNNRVERMLRPAVIARKVSQCSKTWPGAYAFAAFTSVIQTLLKVAPHPPWWKPWPTSSAPHQIRPLLLNRPERFASTRGESRANQLLLAFGVYL